MCGEHRPSGQESYLALSAAASLGQVDLDERHEAVCAVPSPPGTTFVSYRERRKTDVASTAMAEVSRVGEKTAGQQYAADSQS